MIITNIHAPRVEVVDGGQSVAIHLNAKDSVLISTEELAVEVRALLTKAVNHFQDLQREQGSLLDRQAARGMNQANAVEHLGAGGTMRGFTTMPSRATLENGAA